MARILDLNDIQGSIMDLTLRDEARTVVHLDFPSEALVRELEAMGPELKKIESGDAQAVDTIYDLAARLINCNLDFFTVTGRELCTKYGMSRVAAIQFFSAYLKFLKDLENEKN